MAASNVISGYQAGSAKVHALRAAGRYESGNVRYVKVCGTSSRDRYLPTPASEPVPVTCKRCLAKLAR